MSEPVATIGKILLIPSFLGIILGVASAVMAFTSVKSGGVVAGAIVAVASFVSGLLGWLLIMKKDVLKCNSCGAVVPAG